MLVLAVMVIALGFVAAVGASGEQLVAHARAGAVADVSALAGVAGGPGAARAVARASGAGQVRVEAHSDDRVVVEVVVGSTVARAAAAVAAPGHDPVAGG